MFLLPFWSQLIKTQGQFGLILVVPLLRRADPDRAASCTDAADHGGCVPARDAGGVAARAWSGTRGLPLPGSAGGTSLALPWTAAEQEKRQPGTRQCHQLHHPAARGCACGAGV